MEKEAMYYEKGENSMVKCRLCPHNCSIAPGKAGICGVRKNKEGTLYTLIYGEVSSIAMDPIEKKPLYHFYPGRTILSIGTVGCSFRCRFCQNYNISQDTGYPTECHSPGKIVNHALKSGSIGIAYTYSEPFVWYEYVLDTCKAAKAAGMKNVFVTNGHLNREPLLELLPHADAFNVDLKSFNEEFYRKVVGGKLKPVLKTIEEISKHADARLEVTTLIIPGYNDSDEEMEKIADFLSSLDEDIPYHLSAYYPMHYFTAPPTPVKTLVRLKKIASKKLNYVYLGNVREDSSTFCPACGSSLIERCGYNIKILNYGEGKCTKCGKSVPISG